MQAFLDGTGAQPVQMSGTARICLGIGYSTDNADLALGVGAGAGRARRGAPTASWSAFRSCSGYGVPSACDCGLTWTGSALDALEAGARPLVADPEGERLDVLAYAVGALRAPAATEATMVINAAPAEPPDFALPTAP